MNEPRENKESNAMAVTEIVGDVATEISVEGVLEVAGAAGEFVGAVIGGVFEGI